MITSRLSTLMRLHSFTGRNLLQNGINKSIENVRRGHGSNFSYRKAPEQIPKYVKSANALGAFMWWWIFWHLVTDYEELLPRPTPDPSKWTDEELGIPPE